MCLDILFRYEVNLADLKSENIDEANDGDIKTKQGSIRQSTLARGCRLFYQFVDQSKQEDVNSNHLSQPRPGDVGHSNCLFFKGERIFASFHFGHSFYYIKPEKKISNFLI